MSKPSSSVEVDRGCYTVEQFCSAHGLSRRMLYNLWERQTGPRAFKVGTKNLISVEAAAEWRRNMEAASAQSAAA